MDTRSRGGFKANGDGALSWHCFNCGYTANYTPGRHLNFKFRKLLSWIGADDNTVKRLVIDAIRVKELVAPEHIVTEPTEEVSFKPRPLPENVMSFAELRTFLALTDDDYQIPGFITQAVEYVGQRDTQGVAFEQGIMGRYGFYVTDDTEHNMHKRVIIPCYWKNELIGYTARAWDQGVKPKYFNQYDSNYVFNTDRQLPAHKFVLVVEGPFDAMAVDGVAVLTNECSETQADIIDSLGKEVIVVPDFDMKVVNGRKVWTGESLVNQAMEFGWGVSFPVWRETCKDASEAVKKYGQLFVMKSILDSRETSKFKIELMKKRIHSNT